MTTAAQQGPIISQHVGKYRITREIGRGGYGVVYEVVQDSIGHRAAVKLLSAQLADDPRHRQYVDRFLDEARAVNLINHPGVLKIFDLGEMPDRTLYILMEYLDGQTLSARLNKLAQEGKRLPIAQVFRFGRQIAGALAQAHEKGIVHRGLSPLVRATAARRGGTVGDRPGSPRTISPAAGRSPHAALRARPDELRSRRRRQPRLASRGSAAPTPGVPSRP